jgi:hypothetical protein
VIRTVRGVILEMLFEYLVSRNLAPSNRLPAFQFDRIDEQLIARRDFDIECEASRTIKRRLIDLALCAALFAKQAHGYLFYLDDCFCRRSAVGQKLEGELKTVGHDHLQFADLQTDAAHFLISRRVEHYRENAFSERHLMHKDSLSTD